MKTWIGVGIVLVLIAAGVLIGLAWKGPSETPVPAAAEWFVDVTDRCGVNFVHDVGDLGLFQHPQIHGSGVALFDFDGDGHLDILLLSYGGPKSASVNRLFRNDGDGTFTDVSAGSGLDFAGYCTGVAVGDVNNDGRPDVLVTMYGGIKLLLNNGNGKFSDVTETVGLQNPLWGASASFVDYNKDGWLDLVVVNYLEFDPSKECFTPTGRREYCGPLQVPPTVTRLFRNLGRDGKGNAAAEPASATKSGSGAGASAPLVYFKDVTVESRLATRPGPGLGVYCADFNGDGWPDLFIANDSKPNHLWINRKDGTFAEEAYLAGVAVDGMGQIQAGMGVALGDVDGDGRFDVFVTHLASERNTLWLQGPARGQFRDCTAAASLNRCAWRGTGFGTVLGDFDHDGWLDLAVVNGAIASGTATPNPHLPGHLREYSQRNQLFRNGGQGQFKDISENNKAFCGTPNVSRGLAVGDLNGDGALDLVVTNVAGRAQVFFNVAADCRNWLLVRAYDPRLCRDAYGAEVTLRAGPLRCLRLVDSGGSFQCSSDPRVHFGLGQTICYDAIEVLWPDGLAEVFPGGEANRMIVLRRGEGVPRK